MEAPLFKNEKSDDSKVNLGTVCSVKHALEERINEAKHITEEDKSCLREIHRQVNDAFKKLPRSPQTPLSKELRALRHVANRGATELGRPRLLQTKTAEELLNLDAPMDKINLIKDIQIIQEKKLVPYQKDETSLNKEQFSALEKISTEEIYESRNFIPTLVRGKSKNRHLNTIPYMYNQVGGRRLEDYVNASLIRFGDMAFIAAQGPLQRLDKDGNIKYDTVPDFLNILKVGSNTIISLCNDIEGDKEKCAPWWSSELLKEYETNRPEIWGRSRFNFNFRSTKTIDVPANPLNQRLVKRRFNLVYGEHKRVVRQYHMVNWLDGTVPDLGVLEVLIQKVMRHPIEGPLIVHCSSGIGRTGTFILAYKNYKDVHDKLAEGVNPEEIRVNYFYDTLVLRTQRMKMVGTTEQYAAAKDVVRKLKSPET